MSELSELLVTTPVRESSGSRTSSRYDYQKDWALGHLLDLHASGVDYCIVFEHHEDVIVLDNESQPSLCDFFQVKTMQRGHWLLSALLARSNEKECSPLGKLLLNLVNFGVHARTLNFVSNAPFKLELDGGGDSLPADSVCFSLLKEDVRLRIDGQMLAEHAPTGCSGHESILFFRTSSLSLQDHSDHTVGRLARFLESDYPQRNYPVPTLYRTLFDEVRRRHNVERVTQSFQQLVEHKGLSRRTFQSILDSTATTSDDDALWQLATGRLMTEGVALLRISGLRRARTRYLLDRMNSSNRVVQELRSAIGATLAVRPQDSPESLSTLIDEARTAYTTARPDLSSLLTTAYIESAILVEYLSHEPERQFSPPDTAAEDGAQ